MRPVIKLLTSAGVGSRRQITEAIKKGRVAVNGQTVESFLHPVDPRKDRVTIDGKQVLTQADPLTYIMLNKPGGIVSSARDDRNRTTVLDIIPKRYQDLRLYPVGRLDKDTTGLILLTNDGDLTNRLTHPRFEREKEYLLWIEGTLRPSEKRKLEEGLDLEDGPTHGAKVRAVDVPPYNYSIVIHEGKKRQVRRMFAAVGHRVLELKRVRIASLSLGSLPEGHVRELSWAELKALEKS